MSDNNNTGSAATPKEATMAANGEKKSNLMRPLEFKHLIKFVIEKEVSVDSYGSPLLQLVFEKEKKEIKQVSKKIDILDYLLDSSNFDIDLLETFDEKEIYSPRGDPSGEQFYRQLCQNARLPPVGFICEHMKDRNFVMQQHYLTEHKMLLFIEAMKLNTTIQTLDFTDNNMTCDSVVSLCQMLSKNGKIFSLNLSHNNVQMKGVSAISTLLDVTPTLISLFLARNCLENEDITPLTHTLKANFFLTTLDLSYNKISSQGGNYLGGCLAMNETLLILDLHWCQINGKGALELAKGLRNPSLKVLDISWNGFAEESCWSLALSLMVNTTLKILDLTKNRLVPRAAVLLARGLESNHGLEILILDNNLVGDDGVKSILHTMSRHPTLQLVSLQGVRLTEKIYHQVVTMQNTPGAATVLHSDALDINSHLEKLCHVYLSELEKFVIEHEAPLQIMFDNHDPDKKYHLGKEHMRFCLEKTGFFLPLRHMAILLGKLRKNEKNLIAYRPLFEGGISKILKAEELRRQYNTGATRSYFMGPKSAWN